MRDDAVRLVREVDWEDARERFAAESYLVAYNARGPVGYRVEIPGWTEGAE